MPSVTFATLRDILQGLGFTALVTPGSHIWLEHPESGARVLLPPFHEDDPVDVPNLTAVRRYLDEKGLLQRQQFDALLRDRSVAG